MRVFSPEGVVCNLLKRAKSNSDQGKPGACSYIEALETANKDAVERLAVLQDDSTAALSSINS